jgi:uncharacterized surface protein with fasciclin (FAS1) repeats
MPKSLTRPFAAPAFLLLLGMSLVLCSTTPTLAGNSSVEATLQEYGDLSMFYQALLNTGVNNELSETGHYTIFAPTNAAFSQIRPQAYPCFYAEQCRPQIGALLQNHIILDRHDYPNLTTYGQGIASMGQRRLHVVETFPGKYAVEGQTILSKSEVNGNIIYRISGVIAGPQELNQFQTVNYMPPENGYTTERTTTEKTYHPNAMPALPQQQYPAGSMGSSYGAMPGAQSETTTTTHTYVTEP